MSTREHGKEIFERQIKAAGLNCEPLPSRQVHYRLSDRTSRPIDVRLTTSSNETFSLYESTRDISLHVYVWITASADNGSIYALTYDEAFQIIQNKGYTESPSWIGGRGYSVTHSDPELREMLRGFLMSPPKWLEKIRSLDD